MDKVIETGTRVKIIKIPSNRTYLDGMLFFEGVIDEVSFSKQLNEYVAVVRLMIGWVASIVVVPISCLEILPPEVVNHPQHYGGDTPYEVIKVIEAWEKAFPHLNFNLLTAIKYIPRAGIKDPSKKIEDLEKAEWYLSREIDNLKKESKNGSKASKDKANS